MNDTAIEPLTESFKRSIMNYIDNKRSIQAFRAYEAEF